MLSNNGPKTVVVYTCAHAEPEHSNKLLPKGSLYYLVVIL